MNAKIAALVLATTVALAPAFPGPVVTPRHGATPSVSVCSIIPWLPMCR